MVLKILRVGWRRFGNACVGVVWGSTCRKQKKMVGKTSTQVEGAVLRAKCTPPSRQNKNFLTWMERTTQEFADTTEKERWFVRERGGCFNGYVNFSQSAFKRQSKKSRWGDGLLKGQFRPSNPRVERYGGWGKWSGGSSGGQIVEK